MVVPAVPVDAGRSAPQNTSDASHTSSTSSNFQSYAQAARARKRPFGATPAFPRPDLVRGAPVFEHADYKSMERPAPLSLSPNLLYLDLRASEVTAQEALEAAFPLIGNAAISFESYAAQRAVALAFPSEATRAPFIDKPVGDTGLQFYVAPPERAILRRFTLSNVPLYDKDTVHANINEALKPFGELVFLAPMVMASTGWRSNTWHATLRVTKEQAATDPPPLLAILDTNVIVDIPNVRRYCRHCESTSHVKPTCRQGQRQRANKREAMRLDPPPKDQQQQPVPTTTSSATPQEARRPPPTPPPHQPLHPHQQQPAAMDYEPSHQVFVDQLITNEDQFAGASHDHHQHQALTTPHDAARGPGSAFDQ